MPSCLSRAVRTDRKYTIRVSREECGRPQGKDVRVGECTVCMLSPAPSGIAASGNLTANTCGRVRVWRAALESRGLGTWNLGRLDLKARLRLAAIPFIHHAQSAARPSRHACDASLSLASWQRTACAMGLCADGVGVGRWRCLACMQSTGEHYAWPVLPSLMRCAYFKVSSRSRYRHHGAKPCSRHMMPMSHICARVENHV